MMLFKFAKKKVTLDCFISHEQIIQAAPVTSSVKYFPDWWKRMDRENNSTFYPLSTMKNCAGMVDYYKNSVTIPLWSDLAITVNGKNYKWQFANGMSNATVHDLNIQAPGFLSEHGHIKLICPWVFRTKEDINWVWSQPIYNFNENNSDIKIVPAIINFSKTSGANVNIMLPLNQQKNYLLEHGQPLCHLTPMTDKKIEVVRHLVSKQEIESLLEVYKPCSFTRKHYKLPLKKEQFKDCPYKKEK